MLITQDALSKINSKFVLERINPTTPYGKKEKKNMKCYSIGEEEELIKEFDWLEEIRDRHAYHKDAFSKVGTEFHCMKDIEGSFSRAEANEVLTVPEFFEIKSFVFSLANISQAIGTLKWTDKSRVIEPIPELEELLDPEGQRVATFYLYDAYSEELAANRKEQKKVDDMMRRSKKTRRESIEKKLGIVIRSNDEITVSKEDKQLIAKIEGSEFFVYGAESYMNLTFRVRYDDEMLESQKRFDELLKIEEQLSTKVREELTQKLKPYVKTLREQTLRVGKLDLALAKLAFFKGFKCTRPVINTESSDIIIKEGRYLPTQVQLEKKRRTYTPVSIALKNGVTCITGANMGGKTISLKMVGMMLWMAHMALFVPAKEADIALREFLIVSIGDDQDADLGLSTFGAEIVNVAKAIKASEGRGVILIDELARGTNPKEGYALSMSIIETLKYKSTMTLITTHFDGLADQNDVTHLQVIGLEKIDFEDIKQNIDRQSKYMDRLNELMDYRLKEIHTTQDVPKDAIRIAQLMGLDEKTLDRALVILDSLKG